jgi:regulatory protein
MRGQGGRGVPGEEHPDPWEVAIRLLAMRSLTTQELWQRLQRRGYAADQIKAVMERLTASRYLDDAEYARAWARARAHRRSWGPARVTRELRARGIPEREISEALREAFAERDARQLAEAAALRRLPGLQGLAAEVARRRLGAYLTRRGFAVEIALALCRKYFPGAGAPEES